MWIYLFFFPLEIQKIKTRFYDRLQNLESLTMAQQSAAGQCLK